jgi:hypothetical protein
LTEIEKAIDMMEEDERRGVLERYIFRRVNCRRDNYKHICERLDYQNQKKRKVRFVVP